MGWPALIVEASPKRNMFGLPRVISTEQERLNFSLLFWPGGGYGAKNLEGTRGREVSSLVQPKRPLQGAGEEREQVVTFLRSEAALTPMHRMSSKAGKKGVMMLDRFGRSFVCRDTGRE